MTRIFLHQSLLILAICVAAEIATGATRAGEASPVMPCVFQPKADCPQADAAARIYRAAQGQARYLLGKLHPWNEDTDRLLLTESRSAEHWIRPNTGTIEGLAFLYSFGPYDTKTSWGVRENSSSTRPSCP